MTLLGKSVLVGITKALAAIDAEAYKICGFIDRAGTIYPLGSDTKVLSTAFELVTRPFIYEVAAAHKLTVIEADKQNYYPDFTVMTGKDDRTKSRLM